MPKENRPPLYARVSTIRTVRRLKIARAMLLDLLAQDENWNARGIGIPIDTGSTRVWLRHMDAAIAELKATDQIQADTLARLIDAGRASIAADKEAPAPPYQQEL